MHHQSSLLILPVRSMAVYCCDHGQTNLKLLYRPQFRFCQLLGLPGLQVWSTGRFVKEHHCQLRSALQWLPQNLLALQTFKSLTSLGMVPPHCHSHAEVRSGTTPIPRPSPTWCPHTPFPILTPLSPHSVVPSMPSPRTPSPTHSPPLPIPSQPPVQHQQHPPSLLLPLPVPLALAHGPHPGRQPCTPPS